MELELPQLTEADSILLRWQTMYLLCVGCLVNLATGIARGF